MSEKRYSDFIRSSKLSNEYWTETAITDFTEEICRLMDEKGVSRAELAQRIGHSQAYVTKVLRGNVNFTLATMTKLARAIDAVVRVHLAPEGVIVGWADRAIEQPVSVQYINEEIVESILEGITHLQVRTDAITQQEYLTAVGGD